MMQSDFIERDVRSAMAELNAAGNSIAAYAGMTSPRFSRGMNGEPEFSPAEKAALIDTITAMRSLQRQYPVPIAWDQISSLRVLVDGERRKFQQAIPQSAYLIEFDDYSLFERIDDQKKVNRTWDKNGRAGLFKTHQVANAAAEILLSLGFRARVAATRVVVPESRLIERIADLGFAQ